MKAAPRSSGRRTARQHAHDVLFVEDLLDLLTPAQPIVRADVVAAAKARLADGEHPSADAVAGTLVDGLVAQRAR
jgi:hypothetical protein